MKISRPSGQNDNIEGLVISLWEKIFDTKELSGTSNFFMLGGSSLNALQFSSMLFESTGKKAPLTMIFENPILGDLAKAVEALPKVSEDYSDIRCDEENLYEPFELTDVQHAYRIGRSSTLELGSVPTHAYIEVVLKDTSAEAVQTAINMIIQSQPMMRCHITSDGMQQIQKCVETFDLKTVITSSKEEYESTCRSMRNDLERGTGYFSDSCFFAASACSFENKVRLHLLFDAIIFDGKSIFIFLEELEDHLREPDRQPVEHAISYRDHVIALSDIRESEKYKEDKEFVMSRLDILDKLPQFEFRTKPELIKQPTIDHHSFKLEAGLWKRIKEKIRSRGFTANAVLMTLYAEMIALWSSTFEFTLNFTGFNRPAGKEFEHIIGDFTQLLLVPVDMTKGKDLCGRVKDIQEQLALAMDHNSFNAIETERAIGRKTGRKNISFPVVYTGMVDVVQDNSLSENIDYFSTETSQVWLDMQAIELRGELYIDLEAVNELFGYDMVSEMMDAFKKALISLINDELWKSDTPLAVRYKGSEFRDKYNSVTAPMSDETLDSLFVKNVITQPQAPAILSEDFTLSYKELYDTAMELAQKLADIDGKYAAIMLPKGAAQTAAAVGVIMSGKAYVPIDVNNPVMRKQKIISASGGSILITDEAHLEEAKQLGAAEVICFTPEHHHTFDITKHRQISAPDDTAYVIFTSGSTGEPKGVVISHKGAVNTILDVNKRFGVNCSDRTICLSNFNFDLSVYDIFGMLSCGGAIVPLSDSESRDPSKWGDLIKRYKVSVWNSVPAFMQMAMEFSDNENSIFNDLKLVMMSGDVIPTSLPGEIHRRNKDITVVCLGGATEASIWSNYFIADKIEPQWKMMPYGYPLTNQRYYVLNSLLTDCPDNVKGRLYIGGEGLAKGYLADEKKTSEKFITHPATDEKLYDTGDNGMYQSDGVIVFIGRDDAQVKINGHRIELGEVEAVFASLEGVRKCAAVIIKPENKKTGIGVMLCSDAKYTAEEYTEMARSALPEYMLPCCCEICEELPVTANSKTDRKKIAQLLEEKENSRTIEHTSNKGELTETQKKVAEIWSQLLGCTVNSADDDFFECGGDSLMMIKLLNSLNKKFGSSLTPDVFFCDPTVGGIAERLEQLGEVSTA